MSEEEKRYVAFRFSVNRVCFEEVDSKEQKEFATLEEARNWVDDADIWDIYKDNKLILLARS